MGRSLTGDGNIERVSGGVGAERVREGMGVHKGTDRLSAKERHPRECGGAKPFTMPQGPSSLRSSG